MNHLRVLQSVIPRRISDPIGYKRRHSRDNGICIGEPILQYRLRSTFGSQAGRHVKHKEVHEVLQIETIGKVAGNLLHLIHVGACEREHVQYYDRTKKTATRAQKPHDPSPKPGMRSRSSYFFQREDVPAEIMKNY